MNTASMILIECDTDSECDEGPTAFAYQIQPTTQKRIADLAALCVANNLDEVRVAEPFETFASEHLDGHFDESITDAIANTLYVRLPIGATLPPEEFTAARGHQLIVTADGWQLTVYDKYSDAVYLSNCIDHAQTDVFVPLAAPAVPAPPPVFSMPPSPDAAFTSCPV